MALPWEQTNEAKQTATQQQVATETVAAVAESSKKKTPQRKATRFINKNDLEFILDNYKDMSVKEIADKLGLTEFQVRRGVQILRKSLLENAGNDEKKLAKAKSIIQEKLTKPKAASTKEKLDNEVNSLVDSLLNGI